MQPDDRHVLLTALFQTAIDAAHPRRLIPQTVALDNEYLVVQPRDAAAHAFPLALNGRIFLVGAGKGAGTMAQSLMSVLGKRGERVDVPSNHTKKLGTSTLFGGCVIIPSEQSVSALSLPGVRVVRGEHPLPGPGSLAGAQTLLAGLSQLRPHDIVLFCLTGGASSLMVSPAGGLTLADKTATNAVLLECGADILALNTVRKHISQVKGGWLAHHAQPATVVSLILSDVIGDDVSVIGSGPSVPDPTTFRDAWRVVEQYNLETRLPQSVRTHLRQGACGALPETPKPGDPLFSRVHNILIGSNRLALQAIQEAATHRGFRSHLIAEPLTGDTAPAGHAFAHTLRAVRQHCSGPTCILAGGETTVQVRGKGRGGRNQEFALRVAQELAGEAGWSLLSAGTDGIDGPTDAAGAFVDGTTLERARRKNLNADQFLRNNDSYTFFSALGDVFRPGSTGTNVMDIKIALVYPPDAEGHGRKKEKDRE